MKNRIRFQQCFVPQLAIAMLFCWSTPNLFAQDHPQQRPEYTQDEIEALADALGAGDFDLRQRATMQMWSARGETREQVIRAAEDSDPEIASRAKWILDQWRRGADPNKPRSQNRLLQGDLPVAIQELMEMGQFNAAVIAVEESGNLLEYRLIQDRLSKAITLRFPFYAKLASEKDSFAGLLRLIDLVARERTLAVSRARIMQKLGLKLDDETLLPASATDWDPHERDVAKVIVLFVLGRNDAAIEHAEKCTGKQVLPIALRIAGQWKRLAEVSEATANASQIGSLDNASAWADVLFAATKLRDEDLKLRAVKALSRNEDPKSDAEAEFGRVIGEDARSLAMRWRALATYGPLNEAVALLNEDSPEDVSKMVIAASRPEVAMQALGFPPDQIDAKLDDWIQAALDEQLLTPKQTGRTPPSSLREPSVIDLASDVPCIEIKRIFALVRLLIATGYDIPAYRAVDQLCQAQIRFANRRTMRDFVLGTLSMTDRRDWIIKFAVTEGEEEVSYLANWYVSSRALRNHPISGMDDSTLSMLVAALAGMFDELKFYQHFHMACDLAQGKVPEGFDPDEDFARLFDRLKNQDATATRVGGIRRTIRSQINQNVVDLLALHGKTQLASQARQELVMRGSSQALMQIAKQLAGSGKTDDAGVYFDLLWQNMRQKGRGAGLARYSETDAKLAGQTMIHLRDLSVREGDQEKADELRDQIEWSLYSPSVAYVGDIGKELIDGDLASSAKLAVKQILPLAAFDESNRGVLYNLAYSFGVESREDDAAIAVHWYDLAIHDTFRVLKRFYSSAYITFPMIARGWELEHAVKQKDEPTVARILERMRELDRFDINMAEDQLPLVREAGMEKLADQHLEKIVSDGKMHMELFPEDSTMANNVAWVAAMNHRQLEEALKLSRMSIYDEPDSAIFRDTLAEILFQLGRKDEALFIEKSCLLDDDTQWHIHEQIEKYRDAVAAE